jgi:hypothetical protein
LFDAAELRVRHLRCRSTCPLTEASVQPRRKDGLPELDTKSVGDPGAVERRVVAR